VCCCIACLQRGRQQYYDDDDAVDVTQDDGASPHDSYTEKSRGMCMLSTIYTLSKILLAHTLAEFVQVKSVLVLHAFNRPRLLQHSGAALKRTAIKHARQC
jgi:hypothetical protein